MSASVKGLARPTVRSPTSSPGPWHGYPHPKAPATADPLDDMRKRAPGRFAGKRDPALLALGFAGAFRRRAVAREVADLLRVSDGLRVTTLRSETDQEEWERISPGPSRPSKPDLARGAQDHQSGVPAGAQGKPTAAGTTHGPLGHQGRGAPPPAGAFSPTTVVGRARSRAPRRQGRRAGRRDP